MIFKPDKSFVNKMQHMLIFPGVIVYIVSIDFILSSKFKTI